MQGVDPMQMRSLITAGSGTQRWQVAVLTAVMLFASACRGSSDPSAEAHQDTQAHQDAQVMVAHSPMPLQPEPETIQVRGGGVADGDSAPEQAGQGHRREPAGRDDAGGDESGVADTAGHSGEKGSGQETSALVVVTEERTNRDGREDGSHHEHGAGDSSTSTTSTAEGEGAGSMTEDPGDTPSGAPADVPSDSSTTTHAHTAPASSSSASPVGRGTTRVLGVADQSRLGQGFTVPAGEVWEFDPNSDVHLRVSANVVVNGVLRMRPASSSVEHVLEFVNVDERRFEGGGMRVLGSDVGLWVMGNGQLDIQGSRRTGWTNLAEGASKGSRTLVLSSAPVGWRPGDEISVAPTTSPSSTEHYDQFDERRITSINGSVIQLDRPLSFDHPRVNGRWTAEVANLTRNVRIQGTGRNTPNPAENGRAHILIRSSAPQHIKYAQIRHMGPRTTDAGNNPTAGVPGRYSLHFHHSMDGSRGSIVEGVVVRDSGNHAYVPHASHGITMRDNVAYDGWEDAVWWDPPGTGASGPRISDFSNDSDDLMIDRMLVAGLRDDPEYRGFTLNGTTVATGKNVTMKNSVAVGVQGNDNASGYHWPAVSNGHPNNVWTFTNNMAHNNRADGMFVWQNDQRAHVIDGFVAYHNGGEGVEHGAYLNTYQYKDLFLYGNGGAAIAHHSAAAGRIRGDDRADGYTQSFVGLEGGGVLELHPQTLESPMPTLYRDCTFTKVEIMNRTQKADQVMNYDFVNCDLDPGDFVFTDVGPVTRVRVQDGSSAYQLDSRGRISTIGPFYK